MAVLVETRNGSASPGVGTVVPGCVVRSLGLYDGIVSFVVMMTTSTSTSTMMEGQKAWQELTGAPGLGRSVGRL